MTFSVASVVALPSVVPQSAADRPRAMLNALTVDVEDYFQVSAFESLICRSQWERFEPRVVPNTHRLLACLAAAGVQGTFFVLGWVAERFPSLVRDIRAARHEVGCHGFWHRLVYQQSPQEFRIDLRRARDTIQDILGERVLAYRAPSFSITRRSLWALDILIEEGFTIDSSIFPTIHDRYGIPGAPLVPHRIQRPAGSLCEFPLPVHRLLGWPWPLGGGYFRCYPYAFTRRALRSVNARGIPFVFYLHPWEIDPGQPRLPARLPTRVRHYLNLHRTGDRLEALLRDFRLGRLSDLLSQVGLFPAADTCYHACAS
jgi:polysaccharide deacetylase family protein (PEP-CTERM system associated)